MTLVPFERTHAQAVLTWPRDAQEFAFWAALDKRPGPSIFVKWHADPEASAYVLLEHGVPVAYGECWREPAERSVELARLLVAPAHRGRGVGVHLVAVLMEHATEPWVETFWMRVVPENEPARRCYAAAGFQRATAAEERRYNATQPRPYVWLYRTVETATLGV